MIFSVHLEGFRENTLKLLQTCYRPDTSLQKKSTHPIQSNPFRTKIHSMKQMTTCACGFSSLSCGPPYTEFNMRWSRLRISRSVINPQNFNYNMSHQTNTTWTSLFHRNTTPSDPTDGKKNCLKFDRPINVYQWVCCFFSRICTGLVLSITLGRNPTKCLQKKHWAGTFYRKHLVFSWNLPTESVWEGVMELLENGGSQWNHRDQVQWFIKALLFKPLTSNCRNPQSLSWDQTNRWFEQTWTAAVTRQCSDLASNA